jgi:hypothetical protein
MSQGNGKATDKNPKKADLKCFEKIDWYLMFASLIILTISIMSLCWSWLCTASILIAIVDIYFIYVILYAARKSDVYKPKKWCWGILIPNRVSGVIVFVFLYLSVIFSFAEVLFYAHAPNYFNTQEAFYSSFMSITSFEYEHYPSKFSNLQNLQMFQSFNGILLLTATFGFLVARISTFKEKVSGDDIHSLIEKFNKWDDSLLQHKKLLDENKRQQKTIESLEDALKKFKNEHPKDS